ncbi:glycerol-3-phosphate phosphatase-like isoform X2 [Acanthaster planci]|uniref:Glycerol-3-phosphate phosphatase-like isoform X2 n=1 Tax=Acanthaster planci TaxID=133434 RepID=A0A8B7XU41_ACAPL|nr:glycerol-3-phosphate phosphatase-like isoform X2 [Acanthaster planci]
MAACRELREEHAKKFLDSIDTVLFDCDGVIWDATDEIPGAKETLRKLKELGKRIIFITNNSTKSRSQYAKKFTQLGFESVPKDHIFCTSFATAHYLKEKLKFEGKVYLIGEEGLKEELTEYGISFTGPGPDPVVGPQKDWLHIPLDPEVRAVVVSFDVHISYVKILRAASYLSDPTVPFVGTEMDGRKHYPGTHVVKPGTGCIINAVKTAALREPIVLGKPNTYLFECIQQSIKEVDQSRTVMIGDNLNTDIPFGHNCSLKTLFVLTGISTLEEARHFQASNSLEDQKKVPDFYLPSIKELGELIDKVQ